MSKCPNCGAKVELGMKFCGECGTKMPVVKKCPKCGSVIPDAMKFCGECGYSFNASASAGKPIIGDKNVIAGDVNVTNTTTNYIQKDDTKQVVNCVVCGRGVVITEALHCSHCNGYVCNDHYDSATRMCANCLSKITGEAEAKYRNALEKILEDGIVDQDEFEQLERLRKQLGIAAPRAIELQKQMKLELSAQKTSSKSSAQLMTVEKAQCERARILLYNDGNYTEAFKLIQSIYRNHPLNEEVVSIYLTALIGIDEDKVRTTVSLLPVDLACAYMALVDVEIRHGDLAAAEVRLASAEALWPDDVLIKYHRIALVCATAQKLGDRTHLAEAMDQLTSMKQPASKLESSWLFYLQYAISKELGDEVPELTPTFCQQEGVYFSFVRGDLLGQKGDDKIVSEMKRAEELYAAAEESTDDKDYSLAYDAFVRLAQAGSAEAMQRLGLMCRDCKGTDENFEEAVGWFTKAVNAGDNESLYYLSCLYAEGGHGLKKDAATAVKYMTQCASGGDADASEMLGDWYRKGDMGLSQDIPRAVVYYTQASDRGNPDAMFDLGEMYRDGEGVIRDLEQAKIWFKRAAEDYGHDDAMAALKTMSIDEAGEINSQGVAAVHVGNYSKAFACFKKAAELGHGRALRNLGILYRYGHGVNKDVAKWVDFTKKAIVAGNGEAARELGEAYRDGRDVAKDEDTYIKYLLKAAELQDAEALNTYGVWCHDGSNGIPCDYRKAISLYKAAAKLGNKYAMSNLALNYERGTGVPKDLSKAIEWFEKAIAAGNATSARRLATRYLEGKGVEKNTSKAVSYMRKAAEMDDAEAMNKLGLWYDDGKNGLPEDDEKAVRWYKYISRQVPMEGFY